MPEGIPINEAKTKFSELVRRAEAGEEILIRRGPHPVARLVPAQPPRLAPPGSLGRLAWVERADGLEEPSGHGDDSEPPA